VLSLADGEYTTVVRASSIASVSTPERSTEEPPRSR
jgi:hypothetical protein